ncbi:MAG: phosphate transport system regulatory protein PhoU [Thermotoga sp. 4484_232]|nr:MAG: phosphate transport system regulatory protein PhoU [Thermotoga sp. 4484_232]RKX38631.1 MAG: phosphate transport system regulatory protein PhoU [Thermotogota bacterium]RKX48317.1 MAG: phosphate transport system regulatory protein PhoU [Thermotoga sp.]RKX56402.1 MAG: phosphate transport system regulatory protein PhoU [Thermotoga sp.]HDG62572.1 phosphate signaling complex protein PhoU [Thermotoga sp.]
MRWILREKVEEFKKGVLKAGWFAEKMFKKSISSLIERNANLANEVISDDDLMDQMEIEIHEKAMEILGIFTPIKIELKMVTTGIRIAEILENIGDRSARIAKNALELSKEPPLKPLIDIPKMADITSKMVKESLRMFADADAEKSFEICKQDAEVDELYEKVKEDLLLYMMESPKYVKRALLLLEIANFIEEVADLATNIVEATVYMVKGDLYKCCHDDMVAFKKGGGILFESSD